MKLRATTYGYEPNYELDNFDPNIFQNYSNTCAIRSQQIVLRDYGVMLSQEDMMAFAEENGWYDPDPVNGGTPMEALGNFLDGCGVDCTRVENANIYDIISELRDGHRVIVGVDADELWVNSESSFWKRNLLKCINKLNDTFGGEGANHALVVAGVDVNPDDPSDIHVTLIDSGTGEVCASYPYEQFKDAWDDANCYMVSTNEPAPYQYNHETHMMEPSGFATDFVSPINELPVGLENEFRLSESYYNKYDNYIPRYSEDEPISAFSEKEEYYKGSLDEIDDEESRGPEENDTRNNLSESQSLEDDDFSEDVNDNVVEDDDIVNIDDIDDIEDGFDVDDLDSFDDI